MPAPIDVGQIVRLHARTVDQWHRGPVENDYEGFLKRVCAQHEFNYRLWHEEDRARSPDATDREIAEVKRNIDRLNQARNDHIERLDDAIAELLAAAGVVPRPEAPLNTETAGSVIDRLSILSLRLYHYAEQRDRPGADAGHREKVQRRIAVGRQQLDDLSRSLAELLDDLFSGRKRHKTYRQMKMYNDPSLNPYLYESGRRRGS